VTPNEVEALFTRKDGQFTFARWGRPISPVIFGVDDATLSVVKGAFEAVVALAGHEMAETDAELGSNCMVFFFRDWDELNHVPKLDELVPGLTPLVARLQEQGANQYRGFRFDKNGAIRAAFVFLRMDDELSDMPVEVIALGQVVQTILLWSDIAFQTRSPLAMANETTVLRPDIANVIRAAYDPLLPVSGDDASLALRIFARLETDQ
jgi:hypothetical protein